MTTRHNTHPSSLPWYFRDRLYLQQLFSVLSNWNFFQARELINIAFSGALNNEQYAVSQAALAVDPNDQRNVILL